MIPISFKQFFIIIAGIVVLSACSSSKKAVATANRNDVKGTWVLDNINYDGIPDGQRLKLTLLDEGDENCLKGSTWIFPNNGNGSYTIAHNASTGCTPGERNIVWSYRIENGQTILQYKRLPGGVKAKDIADGYKFNIVSATDASLSLRSDVVYEGKTIYINYLFSKK
ncbi:MAG: lipocalin family protein [Chitinophagaceae bacterium]